MKSTLILATLCATAAIAKPLEKRVLVTAYDIETVTMTVTGWPEDSTPTQAAAADATSTAQGWWPKWGGNRQGTAAASSPVDAAPSPSAAPSSSNGWGDGSSSSSWSSAAPQVTSGGSAPNSYAQAMLDAHNPHRANASVPDLVWDQHLADIATQIGQSCVYAHDTSTGGGGYGQNIGAGADDSAAPGMINNDMYNGEINYYPGYGSEPDMGNFEQWGHYSQIVWKSTTSVGCATVHCPGGLANTGGGVSPYFTVCNYSPPGNFGGQYAANVLQPGNAPTITL